MFERRLWPLIAFYLALLWVVSSLLRGKGALAACAGVAALWVCLRAFARGRHRPLYFLLLVSALAAATTLACEALLRVAPGASGRLMSDRLADYALGGYHGETDGVYVYDPLLGQALRPSFRRSMYWNGHAWRHQTNADGYRGPRLARADVVVLGDSMIYGHGVEVGQTVPARFEALTGLATANLGQQGTSLIQGLELLRRTGLRLHPRLVLACMHFTDVADATHTYAPEELRRFVTEAGYRPHARPRDERPWPGRVFDLWLRYVALPLRSGRALQFVLAPPREGGARERAPRAAGRFIPPEDVTVRPLLAEGAEATAAERLGWQANRRALQQIQREAEAGGARLVVFDLGYPLAFSHAVEALARELGATYSDAGRRAMARVRAGEDLYLARDGHWNAAGCEAVARSLALAVER